MFISLVLKCDPTICPPLWIRANDSREGIFRQNLPSGTWRVNQVRNYPSALRQNCQVLHLHRPQSIRHLAAITIVLGLAVSACANRDSANEPSTSEVPDSAVTTPSTSVTTEPASGITFGDLNSPCGPAPEGVESSVDPSEAKGSANVIRVATPTDKGASMAAGLNAELYDAGVAFAKWCNEQGGIAGLPLEVLDADAKLFEVPAQMENICSNAFAMVGGGFAFDDQEFPRFHECGMIDIAGFVVTTAKSQSDNMISPVPNPSNAKDAGWFRWAVNTAPEDMKAYATVYADLLTSQIVEQQYIEAAELIGGVTVVDRIPFNPTGETSWSPIVLRLKSSGVKAMSFVGVPEVLAQLLKAMDEVGYRPNLIMNDAGFYADILLSRAGTSANGVIVRTAFSLFEEADRVPAVRDYLDMMATHNPSGKVAGLGMQSTSAFLLFAQAARDCIVANSGVLTRSCVMAEAAQVTNWTGGGLHAPTDPGTNLPSPCYQMIQVVDGAFSRLFPPLDPTEAERALVPSADITDAGWACDPSTVVQLVGDYGDASIGKLPS